ncbi:MAG TPA: DUF4397 domain-containing protein [Anaeromyxobacteraceae bacterium]|nr:DUF4397 domain-containing protein [Anaeromyxobacteraceae bacterium]
MNLRALAACAAVLALPACSGDSSPTGMVRLLGSLTGGGPVDFSVDGALLVGDVASPGSSGYQPVSAGVHQVAVLSAGTSTSLAQVSLPIAAGEVATVLASGVPGGSPAPVAAVFLDDDSPPSSGYARVRVIHGAAGVAALTVEAALAPEGSSAAVTPAVVVAYRTGEYLLEVPAGRYQLAVADAATLTPVASFPTGALAAGSVTTALLADSAPGAVGPLRVAYFRDLP